MAIYRIDQNQLVAVPVTNFASQDIRERQDLQRLLKAQIEVLDPNLMVLAEEFGDWEDSLRRIDLLCLDRDANLVVVELKRTQDGGHMELQAIRYAAMVSTMTFAKAVEVHARYKGHPADLVPARTAILAFLRWDNAQEDRFAQDVRIILASADFGKELTTAVLWLNQRDLDIRCIRLKPHRMDDSIVLLDVQQIIPLPEATEFQTRLATKERSERQQREGSDFTPFWRRLLAYAKTRTALHANKLEASTGWVGGDSGVPWAGLNYATRQRDSQVEIYIDSRDGERNLELFRLLQNHRPDIEAQFGESLEWEELEGRRACRIRKIVDGGYRSPEDEWPRIHSDLADAMIRLDRSFRPFLQQIQL